MHYMVAQFSSMKHIEDTFLPICTYCKWHTTSFAELDSFSKLTNTSCYISRPRASKQAEHLWLQRRSPSLCTFPASRSTAWKMGWAVVIRQKPWNAVMHFRDLPLMPGSLAPDGNTCCIIFRESWHSKSVPTTDKALTICNNKAITFQKLSKPP